MEKLQPPQWSTHTEKGHIEKQRKHFTCITQSSSSVQLDTRGDLLGCDLPPGGKESRRLQQLSPLPVRNLVVLATLSLCHWGPPKSLLTLTPADEAAWNLPLRVVTPTPLPQPPGIELPLCSYPSQTGVTNTSPTSLFWGCCVHGSTAIPHVCGHWCCS